MAQTLLRKKDQVQEDLSDDAVAITRAIHDRWKAFSSHPNQEVTQRWWNEIVGGYAGATRRYVLFHWQFISGGPSQLPHHPLFHTRRYHSLNHLNQMFQEVDIHRAKLRCPEIIEYAVFFHE